MEVFINSRQANPEIIHKDNDHDFVAEGNFEGDGEQLPDCQRPSWLAGGGCLRPHGTPVVEGSGPCAAMRRDEGRQRIREETLRV